ncbi:MAG: globin, partial [Candidatus Dormiibacterota bacterium]
MSTPTQRHVYEAVGGAPALATLVARFYRGVATDPVLRPIYPEPDLAGAEERLRLFLLQYWGGGSAYSKLRGRPRLGARHAPFSVTTAARDRWLVHMRAALDELGLPAADDSALWSYFRKAAKAMVNVPGDGDQREDRMAAEKTTDYGVRELVEDARRVMEGPDRLTDRQAVVERLAPLLRRALLGAGWTDDEFRTEVDGRPGYRYYVNEDGSLQIYGVLFRQGHPTPV